MKTFRHLAVLQALSFACAVHAAQIPIASYDVEQTPRSGFGCWAHTYTGTIVDTGRTTKQLLPVALLSNANFNAPAIVDRTSLSFGKTGHEASLASCQNNSRDVNGDGRPDLICFFNVDNAGFQAGDVIGVLRGLTQANAAFAGQDTFCTFACR